MNGEPEPQHCKEELELLKLLEELQGVLTAALNSLANQKPPSVESRYIVHAAKAVNLASDGYILLRGKGKLHASKMMVRPMIEVVIKSIAVTKKKGFLSALAYTELREMKKMHPKTPENEAIFKAQVEGLRNGFSKDPTYPIELEEYNFQEIADVARLLPVYETAYRVYCKFTHSAVAAVDGKFDDMTDPIDTSDVIWAVSEMLNQLKLHTPAAVPDLRPYNERLANAVTAMDDAWNGQS